MGLDDFNYDQLINYYELFKVKFNFFCFVEIIALIGNISNFKGYYKYSDYGSFWPYDTLGFVLLLSSSM
jgi:hypothetical protein